ncbi:MAG: AMP-binding protein [Fastidiosipilaceae bacterium]|jgi:long-chain acyl-CoA synthetase
MKTDNRSAIDMRMREKDLKALVDYAAETYGEHSAYRYKVGKKDIESKSFNDLKKDTEAFGNMLEGMGRAGQHIAVQGPTGYEWVVTYLGTVNSNSVIVPMNNMSTADDICELINRAHCTVYVYDHTCESVAEQVRAQCPAVEVFLLMRSDSDTDKALSLRKQLDANQGPNDTVIDREKMCTILYTSGTTGKPKGVMLCHRNLIDNTTCVDIRSEGLKVVLSVLPVHHVYCFTCDILLGIFYGLTICVNDSIMRISKNLALFKPDTILLVPMIIEAIYNKLEAARTGPKKLLPKKLIASAGLGGNLTTIYSGGAYLNPDLVDKFADYGIDLYQGYGMTECSPRISNCYPGHSKKGSIGQIVGGCEVRILDDEIQAKSDSVMLGYYEDPENTAETLIDGGWLRTGDLGYVDEDNFLFITGRKKNLIITGSGENISPESIENAIESFDIVKEVVAYSKQGVITAEIYPNLEYAEKKRIKDIPKAIREAVDQANQTFPLYMKVTGVVIRDEPFPRNTSGKIMREYNEL